MLTFQQEKWRDQKREEIDPIFRQHWEEIALNRDVVPLDVDYERYSIAENAGRVHIVTVRDDGRLVGYYCALLDTHFHYKGTMMAFTDVYFLLPAYRRADTAFRLFCMAEKTLKERGITKLIAATKLHQDKGRLFAAMGWTEVERVFTKVLR